ncbi:hypothetical protein VRB37_16540 [Erwinia billingiae]|uniref:hypothetical protein n=1 Tax=Erwinia billingiae TaxID=182337 RepID=UPI0030D2D138
MNKDDIFKRFLSDLDEQSFDEQVSSTNTVRMLLDETKDEDWERAHEIYEEIRLDISDIQKISINIKKTERVVTRVKDHLFFREHIIIVNDVVEKRRLDADPEIANSWSRLSVGDFVPSDIALFEHEQVESILEKRKQLDYKSAHIETLARGYTWDPEEAYNGDPGES